ncbi:MAG: hypothetical protein A2169_15885 [Deltaproteobacteria bacterium RBG_13_47_9]|nr:MAG: hypothetical protein A2169_15885 [Deltaproteobacteria bacterium RBG_13_47_9]
MRRTIALVDWDGTVRRDFTIRSWMKYLHSIGSFSRDVVSDIESQFLLYLEGKIPYEDLAKSSAEIYARSVEGMPVEMLRGAAHAFLESDISNLLDLPVQLLSELRSRNIEPVIVSGAPCEVLTEYKGFLNLRNIFCLQLAIEGSVFNGEVDTNPGISSVKHEIVRQLLLETGTRIALAVGNSSSDEPLFNAADLTVIVGDYIPHVGGKIIRLTDRTAFRQVLMFLDKEEQSNGSSSLGNYR